MRKGPQWPFNACYYFFAGVPCRGRWRRSRLPILEVRAVSDPLSSVRLIRCSTSADSESAHFIAV